MKLEEKEMTSEQLQGKEKKEKLESKMKNINDNQKKAFRAEAII